MKEVPSKATLPKDPSLTSIVKDANEVPKSASEQPPKSAKTLNNGGKLIIIVRQGKLFRDEESLAAGKMDPYVVIEHKGKQYKTPVHEEAGKTPVWNYTLPEPFIFKAPTTGNEEFYLKCMEDDYGRDDDVGDAVVKLSDLVSKELTGVVGKWFTLTFGKKNEKAAEIQIDTTFVPN